MKQLILENFYSRSLFDVQNTINERKEYYKSKRINTTVIIYEINHIEFKWFTEIYGDRKV